MPPPSNSLLPILAALTGTLPPAAAMDEAARCVPTLLAINANSASDASAAMSEACRVLHRGAT
jgi:hypothetical protein